MTETGEQTQETWTKVRYGGKPSLSIDGTSYYELPEPVIDRIIADHNAAAQLDKAKDALEAALPPETEAERRGDDSHVMVARREARALIQDPSKHFGILAGEIADLRDVERRHKTLLDKAKDALTKLSQESHFNLCSTSDTWSACRFESCRNDRALIAEIKKATKGDERLERVRQVLDSWIARVETLTETDPHINFEPENTATIAAIADLDALLGARRGSSDA